MKKKRFIYYISILILLLAGCGKQTIENVEPDWTAFQEIFSASGENMVPDDRPQAEAPVAEGELKVHFIDVGQGDATLIQAGEYSMLIDAGENNQGEKVVSYIKDLGIDRLEYVIGTHPHSDHIGGLDDVIGSFEIGTVILPDKIHTSKTFEDVLEAMERKELSITLPEVGTEYLLGEAAFTIIAPVDSYGDNLNNWSVGIRLVHGSVRVVMTGDAEKKAESDMLGTELDMSAEVLKLGHHGSDTSSSDEFLEAVSPDYCVISCGKDNMYGHPHQEILGKLNGMGVEIYRTDEAGTIIAVSDGQAVTWNNN